VVELAIVLPLFVLLVIGAIDVGRAIGVRHKLVEAARAGVRLYAVKGQVPADEVAAAIEKVLDDAGLAAYSYTFDPTPSSGIAHLAPVRATVSIPYEEVSWLPVSWFLEGRTLSASCVMPGDTGEISASPGS
jgi:Flp pilus assembly protein TadG